MEWDLGCIVLWRLFVFGASVSKLIQLGPNYCFIGNIKVSEVKCPPVLSTICSGTKVNGRRAHSWEIELGGLAPQFELTSLPEIELQQLASLFTFLNPEEGSIPYTFNISRSILRGFSIIACATHEGDWIPKVQQIQQYIYVT